MSTLSLTSRPLDLLYFSFFAIHVPTTLLLDLQPLYPPALIPAALSSFMDFYLNLSNDPLVGGLSGAFGNVDSFLWFKSFVYMEAFFQLPVFLIGMYGLWKGSRSVYILLMLYGASTATTVVPCLSILLTTPATDVAVKGVAALTAGQRLLLLGSYVPFFLLPLFMALDMAGRVSKLMSVGIAEKSK